MSGVSNQAGPGSGSRRLDSHARLIRERQPDVVERPLIGLPERAPARASRVARVRRPAALGDELGDASGPFGDELLADGGARVEDERPAKRELPHRHANPERQKRDRDCENAEPEPYAQPNLQSALLEAISK